MLAGLIVSIAPVQTALPNRQPQLASAQGLTALVFGSGQSIWFSASRDGGEHFSSPAEVTQVPVLALGRHRGPRVGISGQTVVMTAVAGQTAAAGPHAHGLSQDGDLLAWRSSDEGRSWSKPVTINDVPGSAREGLHSIAVSDDGEMAAVWLDLRGSGTRLYGAFSSNHGLSWSKNVLLYQSSDGTICQCCDPSIAFSGPQRAQVMFRDVLGDSRDMHLISWQLNGGISDAKKLGAGSWRINACPMDGGGIVYRHGQTFTAWRRDETVYLDQPGKPETALGQGKDVALAAGREGPFVIWTGLSGIELWTSVLKTTRTLSASGGFPTLTVLPKGAALAAWENGGQIEIERIH